MTVKVNFKKLSIEDGERYYTFKDAYFSSNAITILNINEISDAFNRAVEQILNKVAEWISEASGWIIELLRSYFINIFKYIPPRERSYIPLPKELQNSKKGLINLKNRDNECFRWCHVRYLNPIYVHPERITKSDRESVKTLDYSGISFPVTIKQIDTIENQYKININVFGYPIRISKQKYEKHMELLYITDGKKKTHYVFIKDFNRLMFGFNSHIGKKKRFCMNCLQCFCSENDLEKQNNDCIAYNGVQATVMPKEGSKSVLKNHHKQLPAAFGIYADF